MSLPQHHAILNRSLELESGFEADYKPVDIPYLASLELGSLSKTLHTLRGLETSAWAKAEYCLVRDVGRLLNGEAGLLDQWSALSVSEDPTQLQTKAQLLSFLAKIIRGTLPAKVAESGRPAACVSN